MKKKLILTDCDGVLLNWSKMFDEWMYLRGYHPTYSGCYSQKKKYGFDVKPLIEQFNESTNIGYLKEIPDAAKYVMKLMSKGYRFGIITSMSNNTYSHRARMENLSREITPMLFNYGTIEILGCGDDKDEALEKYRDSKAFWIEDKMKNAEVGYHMGLQSIVFDHGFEENEENPLGLAKVKSWKEIYDLVN